TAAAGCQIRLPAIRGPEAKTSVVMPWVEGDHAGCLDHLHRHAPFAPQPAERDRYCAGIHFGHHANRDQPDVDEPEKDRETEDSTIRHRMKAPRVMQNDLKERDARESQRRYRQHPTLTLLPESLYFAKQHRLMQHTDRVLQD